MPAEAVGYTLLVLWLLLMLCKFPSHRHQFN